MNPFLVTRILSGGADWSKAATVLGVAAVVVGAIKEIWKDDEEVKELKRKVKQLEDGESDELKKVKEKLAELEKVNEKMPKPSE